MKTIFTVIVLFVGLSLPTYFALKTSDLIDYRLKLSKDNVSTFKDRSCSSNGLLCKNCQELVFCTPDGSGGWTERPVAQCKDGTACDGTSCVKVENVPECSPLAELPFLCSTVGVFPDPANCKKYHICYPDAGDPPSIQNVDINCENDHIYYYNPKTYFCDKKLPASGKCSGYPVPLCKNPGDDGPLSQNPSLYHVCLPYSASSDALYPFQFACVNGKTYSSTYGCR